MVPLTGIVQRRWIPYVLLAALTVVTAIPLLPLAPFYSLDDSLLHLYRLTEFDRLVGQGIRYPRWAPDFAYGYGYPVFNFYPPLAYYAIEVVHLLGATMPVAMTLSSIGMVGLAIAGAYALGIELFDESPHRTTCGVLTAVAYGFFPYLLIDPYQRGALPETLGAAMLPWCLWAIHRLIKRPSIGAMLLASFAVAGFVLAHNLTAFFAAPILLVFAVIVPNVPLRARMRGWLWLVGAVALAALLSAIYTVPSLLELDLVVGSHEAKELGNLFNISFQNWQNVVQWSVPYQYHEQPFPISALPLVLSAIAVVLALAARPRGTRRIVVFFAAAIALLMPLLLDVSRPFWLGLPLVDAFQFPWRISTFIGMSTAVLIGSLPVLLAQTRGKIVAQVYGPILAGVAVLLIWNGMANLQPKRLDNPTQELTLGQIARAEQNTGSLGFGWLSEFLPMTVKAMPVSMPVAARDENPARITLAAYDTTRREMTVKSEHATTISLRQFYFPGWNARVDGAPAPTFPTTALGLLSLNVPAGEHTVEIEWQDTPARQIGSALTVVGVVLALGLAFLALRRRDNVAGIVTVFGAVLFVMLVFAGPVLAAKPAPIQKLAAEVGPGLRAVASSVQNATLAGEWQIPDARDALEVTVYWQVRQTPSKPDFVWRLVDNSTQKVWAAYSYNSRFGTGFPGAWVPNEIVEDHYTLALPPALPPGAYRLEIAASGGMSVTLAQLLLSQGTPSRLPVRSMRLVDAQFGNDIRLLGFNAPRTAKPNDTVPFNLYWDTKSPALEDFTVFVHLVDNQGNLVAQQDGMPQDSFFPTSLWLPERIVSDNYRISLLNLNPGIYRWAVGLYRRETMERLPFRTNKGFVPDDEVVIGELKVPMSVKTTPSHLISAQLGSEIQLAGYDLMAHNYGSSNQPRPGDDLALNLYWRANASIYADYKVFVHVVDEAGNVVAQDDAWPARNTYPTRIWDPGEVVLDSHTVTLPTAPGRYRIIAGMYDAVSGERLPIVAGGAELPDRQIELQTLDASR